MLQITFSLTPDESVSNLFDSVIIAYILSDAHQDSVQETQEFTYKTKILYFHLLPRTAWVLSKPGLTGAVESRAPA